MDMQKIYYEKEIDLSHKLKELTSLTVDESIDYKIEENGVRAVGSLIVKGEYVSDQNKLFVENIELDIYADEKKITDQRDFHLKVEDFEYEIVDGNLKITIEVGVYGVEDGKDRFVSLQSEPDPVAEIEELSRTLQEENSNEQMAEVPEETVPLPEEKPVPLPEEKSLSKKVYETKTKEPKDDGDEDTGVYYLYVIGPNDTYSSIAEHYHVDEKVIRNYNGNIDLVSGQVIIIPYVAPENH